MNRKSLLFVVLLVVVSLSAGNRALAEDSAAQPPRQDAEPKRFANSDNPQAPSDEDIQLLRKDSSDGCPLLHAAR